MMTDTEFVEQHDALMEHTGEHYIAAIVEIELRHLEHDALMEELRKANGHRVFGTNLPLS